jgi:hypothetical protein
MKGQAYTAWIKPFAPRNGWCYCFHQLIPSTLLRRTFGLIPCRNGGLDWEWRVFLRSKPRGCDVSEARPLRRWTWEQLESKDESPISESTLSRSALSGRALNGNALSEITLSGNTLSGSSLDSVESALCGSTKPVQTAIQYLNKFTDPPLVNQVQA